MLVIRKSIGQPQTKYRAFRNEIKMKVSSLFIEGRTAFLLSDSLSGRRCNRLARG